MKLKLLNLTNLITILYFTALIFLILTNPDLSVSLSKKAADTWWNNIFPSILPFMIISKCMIDTNAADFISNTLSILIKPIFKISNSCIYIIIIGFLCGFPMGSITIQQCIKENKISKTEAEYLLFFTNNISPAFFITYIFQKCPYKELPYLLFMQYMIPILIGLFLRYTFFKNRLDMEYLKNSSNKHYNNLGLKSFFTIFPNAVKESIITSFLLLGTIIIFSLIQLPIYNNSFNIAVENKIIIKSILEISSSIETVSKIPSLYSCFYTLILPFNGFSCLMQAYCVLAKEEISFYPYVIGKLLHLLINFIFFID